MAKSIKKDIDGSSGNNEKEKAGVSNKSLILLVIVLFIFVAIYFVSVFVGGPMKEFYTAALPFMMAGLLIIGIIILRNAKK